MITYFPTTFSALLGKKNRGRGFGDVISAVVSRPPSVSHSRSSLAKFRSWREGTDPAMRGREGRRKARRATGGMI